MKTPVVTFWYFHELLDKSFEVYGYFNQIKYFIQSANSMTFMYILIHSSILSQMLRKLIHIGLASNSKTWVTLFEPIQ